jgi:hypothetical protein
MRKPLPVSVKWSQDFVIIDGSLPAALALRQVQQATERWVIISRFGGRYLYAFTRPELWRWLARTNEVTGPFDSPPSLFEHVLGLHEEYQSTVIENRVEAPPIDCSWRPDVYAPSIRRYIEVGTDRKPRRIGMPKMARGSRQRSAQPSASAKSAGGILSHSLKDLSVVKISAVGSAAGQQQEDTAVKIMGASAAVQAAEIQSTDDTFSQVLEDLPVINLSVAGSEEGQQQEGASPLSVPTSSASQDEGIAPIRYPSIESDVMLFPGADLTFMIDLVRAEVLHTSGDVDLGRLPGDWESLDLSVILTCPCIEFATEGRGVVTIRRNKTSLPAPIRGHVQADAPVGEDAVVIANFFLGTRFCGSAFRKFTIGNNIEILVRTTKSSTGSTRGTVVAEPAAERPDVTIHISKVSNASSKLDWLVVVSPLFDGLPPNLREQIDLGHDPRKEAESLFREFATIERGQHRERIEGFGDKLWQRAPQMFRDVYWALWDRYRRPLTIQFISDEPHLPWELMRPTRTDDSEFHPPLALKHAVARWIARWEGYMRNKLPGGRVFTIAPHYATVSRRVPRAQTESESLVKLFDAKRVDGTRQAVTALLKTVPSPPVAVLHFAGHGQFLCDATSESTIKLEDGPLAASEVGGPEIKLGKDRRTLVFFNACEVGATGTVLGEVGGWADAFLGRQFGGFIAPLWSVDDEDASVVAADLLEGIVNRHEPIGEVLRAVREKYGNVSPTFYSYLYYGDVTARLSL